MKNGAGSVIRVPRKDAAALSERRGPTVKVNSRRCRQYVALGRYTRVKSKAGKERERKKEVNSAQKL